MEKPQHLSEQDSALIHQNIESELIRFENEIAQAPLVSPVDRSKAPFRNYFENTDSQWLYVQPDDVELYLLQKFFFDVNDIPFEDKVSAGEIDFSDTGQQIKIPLDLVIYAAGFKDWRGRGEDVGKTWISKFGSGELKSHEVLKHYAGLSTELPGVARVNMYRQPDGKIYFSNASGDSHRISASILRGCEFIETSRVSIYDVQKNYI